MLDAETKRKIDNCRDILVGKIPDPKSQVEQITIALIYKFMDDMDQLSVYQGGKPSFFRGEFEKYSWSSIFDRRLGGQEILNLYGEALVKMNQNPNIPQLFRDIFKNAFLPYRDPETLRLFLKEISVFTYDHSERLGDAFEYLLSVLSSQGKAGQFRTPRHIIDFIVKVINPQLNQTVLDPACGTAGFLISAYKHIVKNNPKLSTTQKQRLMKNFVGYDISADMVRLSLVNMYLHGFPNPHIYEYDTLTYEDRWNDTFDIIMANPPFMSPKGGIHPHGRFSIKAKRSEVLFVDYIAEHLNPGGRAGVIVPEGIIFQSQKAYKALRKMLVENYLWAVVSLPAGVFNPYSGVKTSILLMDKSLVKRIDKILFVKIENDGFDLGAQRRKIDQDDLPLAQKCLNIYKSKIENHKLQIKEDSLAHAVLKSEIAKSGDYNLTGDRYRILEQHKPIQWPTVELGDVCIFIGGFAFKSDELENRKLSDDFLPVIKIGNLSPSGRLDLNKIEYFKYSESLKKYLIDKNDILIAMTGATVGKVSVSDQSNLLLNQRVGLIRANENKITKGFLIVFLLNDEFYQYCQITAGGGAQGNISPTQILKYKIPLPSLDVQEKIVAEIDGYQKIIDAARQIVQSYKPTIKINPDWPMVALSEVSTVISGQSPEGKYYNQKGEGMPFYQGKSEFGDIYIGPPQNWTTQVTREAEKEDILMSVRAPVGPVNLSTQRCCIGRGIASIRASEKIETVFLFNYLKSIQDRISGGGGSVFDSINRKQISELQIPLPPLSVQKEIVVQIEAEQKIVNENKKLIEIFEKKISETISVLWS